MPDRVKAGEVCKIPGLPGMWRRLARDFNRWSLLRVCPKCGGPVVIANDWATCKNAQCGVVAVVRTGESFEPVKNMADFKGGVQ